MKHIKKKYLIEKAGGIEHLEKIGEVIDKPDAKALKKAKNKHVFATTEDGKAFLAFLYNLNGQFTAIPLPDLSLVYFDGAYNLNELRKQEEKLIIGKVKNAKDGITENMLHDIYRYYGHASGCIISLFTALESFINHIIPNDIPYIKTLSHKTEYYNKEQIQKNIQFDDKVKSVIPYFFNGKSFNKSESQLNQYIEKLKVLRDDIVHPKSDENFKKQEELVKKLLNFQYDKTFEAVAGFMNYYKTSFVEECDCGVDM